MFEGFFILQTPMWYTFEKASQWFQHSICKFAVLCTFIITISVPYTCFLHSASVYMHHVHMCANCPLILECYELPPKARLASCFLYICIHVHTHVPLFACMIQGTCEHSNVL